MFPRLRASVRTPRGLLILGLLVREALSFWTGHPYDLEVWLRTAFLVSRGANPYDAFMPPVPGSSFAFLNDRLPGVGYLSLWPLMVAGLYRIYALLPANRFVLYFLLKQPPVWGDVLLGYYLYRSILQWSGKPVVALRGLRFWMFFPYAIIISSIWGQFDALVLAIFMAGLLSTKFLGRYSMTGLGILLKWLPVIFLPYFFFRERGIRRLGGAVALLIPSAVTLAIFWIAGWDFTGVSAMSQYASHGGGGGMTYMNLLQAPLLLPVLTRVPGFYVALGYLWVPGAVLAGLVASRRFSGDSGERIVQVMLLILSVFFLSRWGVNEQYLIYFLPFFYVDVVLWHPNRKSLLIVAWVLALLFLLANNDLLLRFFGPLDVRAIDIAYAFDNYSDLSPLRSWAMYVLDVLLTIHLLQLASVFLNPLRDPAPWLLRPFARLHLLAGRVLPEVRGNP